MFGGAVLFNFVEENGQNNVFVGPGRVFRDRADPLYISDNHLIRYYRFPRQTILDLCQQLEPALGRPTQRSHAIPVHTQVLIGLRFLASGSFQNVIGDVGGVGQSSCSRVITSFCNAIVALAPQSIHFPLGNPGLIARIKADFYRIAHFPNVIGAIDGTHIDLKSPVEDEASYVDRHGNHSLNVQGICDANLRLLNIVVRWPGSTHDSFMWRQSRVKEQLDTGIVPSGWLLGDSGYPLETHLMTPVRNPEGAEALYNDCHSSTRCTIERCFGVLKSRFRSIDKSGGTLMYSPPRACNIVITACVLHNWCIERNIPLMEPLVNVPEDNINLNNLRQDPGAVGIRNQLIQRFAVY